MARWKKKQGWGRVAAARAALRERGDGSYEAFMEYRQKLWEESEATKAEGVKRLSLADFSKEALENFPPTPEELGESPAESAAAGPPDAGAGDGTGSGVSKDIWVGKPRNTFRADVEWVGEHLVTAGLEPEDAPSMRAWRLWTDYHKPIDNRILFDQIFQTKLLPTQRELRKGDLESDDGLDVVKHLDTFEAGLSTLSQSAERPGTERDVAQGAA